MAIRVEHQPSAATVGLAAYRTGRGAMLQRQQKYALDILRDQNMIQARREGQLLDFKYNQVLNQQRQTAINERDTKLHDWETAAATDERNWRTEEAKRREDAIRDRDIAEGLDTGALELTPTVETKIKEIEAAYSEEVAGMSADDPMLEEARAKADEQIRQLKRRGGTQRVSAEEQHKRRARVQDPVTGELRIPGEGEKPDRILNPDGTVDFIPLSPAEEAAREDKKAQQEAEAQRAKDEQTRLEKEEAARIKRRDDLAKMYIDSAIEGTITPEDAYAAADEQIKAENATAAGATVAQVDKDGKVLPVELPEAPAPAAPPAAPSAPDRGFSGNVPGLSPPSSPTIPPPTASPLTPPGPPVETRPAVPPMTEPGSVAAAMPAVQREQKVQQGRAAVQDKAEQERAVRQRRLFFERGVLPDDAVRMPDGSILYEGQIYRRKK